MIVHYGILRWKDLFLERKEQNKRAASIAKDASEGRFRIEAEQRYSCICGRQTDFQSFTKVSIEQGGEGWLGPIARWKQDHGAA